MSDVPGSEFRVPWPLRRAVARIYGIPVYEDPGVLPGHFAIVDRRALPTGNSERGTENAR